MEPIEVAEIMRVPVISTAHYTQEDDDILGNITANRPWKAPVYNMCFGFLVFIDDYLEDQAEYWGQLGMSEAFIHVLERLAESGYSWVRFDRDAAEIDELPSFDW